MIKQLHIVNYGPHENYTFNFHSGINIIIGEGCEGKTSAVLRPLRLLKDFRPTNFKFHSHFAKSDNTKVSILFDDDIKVELNKTKKESKYIIKYKDKKEEFRKFKTTVPEPVISTLNLNELNFQYQLDSHFIVSESAGNITKIINRITNTDSVDKWIKNINSEIKDKTILLKNTDEELKETKSKLKKLSKLKEIEKYIKQYKDIKNKIEQLENKHDKIEEIINDINRQKKSISTFENNFYKIEKSYKKLQLIKMNIDKKENIKELLLDYVKTNNNIKDLKIEIKVLINKFIKELKKTKKCPTCFSNITSKIIKNIKIEFLK